jgi:mRNA-degrading endonuclease toxin of MazEF toxin-antitoxin module
MLPPGAEERIFLLLAALPVVIVLGWITVLLASVARVALPDWLMPVRGRWRELLLIGGPAVLFALALPWPANVALAVAVAASAAWWRLRLHVLTRPAPRAKSIDVGTGIRLIPETGGRLPDDLRFELAVWDGCSGVQETASPTEAEGLRLEPGDICWVRLPAPPGSLEAECRRPAVVLQSAAEGAAPPTVIVVPLTHEVEALRFPGTVPVEPDTFNGLAASLVALVFRLVSVDRTALEPTRGRLSPGALQELWGELDRLAGGG